MVRLTTKVIVCYGFAVLTLFGTAMPAAAEENAIIVYPKDSALTELGSAREIRRYLYLRTNRYVPVTAAERRPLQKAVLILVGQKDKPLVRQVIENDTELGSTVASLQPQEFKLKTIRNTSSRCVLIAGGDSLGTLYGAYRFIEHLGVRFFLNGDVIPDKNIALELPDVDGCADVTYAQCFTILVGIDQNGPVFECMLDFEIGEITVNMGTHDECPSQ